MNDEYRPIRHAVLCGVYEYPDHLGSLDVVSRELQDLSVLLTHELHSDFRYDDVYIYSNEELTDSSIDGIFDAIRSRVHVDEFLFYLAGHGTIHRNKAYFVTYPDQSGSPGIRVDELMELVRALPAKRILFIADFCHAGAAAQASEQILAPLSSSASLAVLAACRGNEVAATGDEAHPSFTTCVIRALRGRDSPPDGVIRWGDVARSAYAALKRSPYQRSVDRLPEDLHRLAANQCAPARSPTIEVEPRLSDDTLEGYLDHIIKSFDSLDLRGLSGTNQSLVIPLDRIYVDLQAEPDNPAERDYDRRLLEQDIRAYIAAHGLDPLDDLIKAEVTYKVLCRDAYSLRILQSGEKDSQGRPIGVRRRTMQLGEVVRDERRAIILGDPGCGKTTLLRYCALHFARAMRARQENVVVDLDPSNSAGPGTAKSEQESLGPTRLPIYIRIASYAEARREHPKLRVADFLANYWISEQVAVEHESLRQLFSHYLKSGQVLLLFDGLDEIPQLQERSEIVRQVELFVQSVIPSGGSGQNQVLVTSRIAGYHAAPFRDAMTHYTVCDLSDDAISLFLRRWCLAIEQHLAGGRPEGELHARAEAERNALVNAIARSEIRRLAVNPLLLTLLALLNRTKNELPRLRIDLYRNAVRTLVETWRRSSLSETEVLDVLCPVALWIHENNPTGLISEADLREQITGTLAKWRGLDRENLPGNFKGEVETFIEMVRRETGILLARGEGLYGFTHLTFQEYFVARQISWRPADVAPYLAEHLTEPRWREPLLLAIGQVAKEAPGELPALFEAIESADIAHDELIHHKLLFMGSALPECARVPASLGERICRGLFFRYVHSLNTKPFFALCDRIESLFKRIRGSHTQHFVVRCLEEALVGADDEKRRASLRIIGQVEWFTPSFLSFLIESVSRSPDAFNLSYLQSAECAGPSLLSQAEIPLRTAARRRPTAWSKLLADCRIRDLIVTLHAQFWLADDSDASIADHLAFSFMFSPVLVAALHAEDPVNAFYDLLEQKSVKGSEGVWAIAALGFLGQHENYQNLQGWAIDAVMMVLVKLLGFINRWTDHGDRGFTDQMKLLIQSWSYVSYAEDVRLEEPYSAALSQCAPLFRRTLVEPLTVESAEIDAYGAGSELGRLAPRERVTRIVTCGFMRLLTSLFNLEVVAVSRGAQSAEPDPTEPKPDPTKPTKLRFRRREVRRLTKQLLLDDDETREAAKARLSEVRSLMEVGWETVLEIRSQRDRIWSSTHPLRGFALTCLATAMASVRCDDATLVRQWLTGLDKQTQRTDIENYLNYCGSYGEDVLAVIDGQFEHLESRTQNAIIGNLDYWFVQREGDTIARMVAIGLQREEPNDTSIMTIVNDPRLGPVTKLCRSGVDLIPRLLDSWSGAPPEKLPILAVCLGVAAGCISAQDAGLDRLAKYTDFPRIIDECEADKASSVEDFWVYVEVRVKHCELDFDDTPRFPSMVRQAESIAEAAENLRRWRDEHLCSQPPVRPEVDQARRILRGTTAEVCALGHLLLEAHAATGDSELPRAFTESWTVQVAKPETALEIIIAALSAGEAWNAAKQRIVLFGAFIIEGSPPLLLLLRELLRGKWAPWVRRAVFEVLAVLAERSPSLFNCEGYPELERDLIDGCFDINDWNCRELSIRTLARLRHLHHDTGGALLHLCKDTKSVREATIEAARSFQSFDPTVIEQLAPALTGASVVTAETAAKLLTRLGTSRQAISEPMFRARIADTLASASRDPSASRQSTIFGTLGESFYRGLLEITD